MRNRAYTTALKIVRKIYKNGFTAFFAGGAVRDQLLGRTPKDYDIATNARPDQIEALFPKTIAVGKAFGVMVVVEDGLEIEVATFRKDAGYQDGRRPDSVDFCGAKEDAIRRDFTINGMFYDPQTEAVIDYVDGRSDLALREIRAIGEPERRFAEDHLRMLRAVRFAHTLGFRIDPATRAAIRARAADLATISRERIEREFSRILTESQRPGDALRELVELGLAEQFLPEILPMIGQEQPREFHPEGDVFDHTCLMLNLMVQPPGAFSSGARDQSFRRRLAYSVLLHDIGKPATAFVGADRIRFHGHERKSAQLAEPILRRLRLPRKAIEQIVAAVDGHMRFKDVQKMNRSTLRKLMGAETFELELELHRLDCTGSHGLLDNYHFLQQQSEAMAHEPILPARWISGADLIALGIRPGPALGALLQQAYDLQLNGGAANRRELIDWLKRQVERTANDHKKILRDTSKD